MSVDRCRGVINSSCLGWLGCQRMGERLRLRRSARAAQPGARSRRRSFPSVLAKVLAQGHLAGPRSLEMPE
jgi:hypothetical protein